MAGSEETLRKGAEAGQQVPARRMPLKRENATRKVRPANRGASKQRSTRHERRVKVGKALACAAVLAIGLLLAFSVGDADYRATAVGWAPFVACAAAIVGAFAYLQVIKRNLRLLERSDLGDCVRGELVNFTVRFQNTCPLFFTRIEAHFFVGDMFGGNVSKNMTTLVLSPFEVYDMTFGARFDHIGTYRAGLDYVVVTDFLRLFTARIDGPGNSMVQVTPRIALIERLEFSNEAILETTKAQRSVLADSNNYMGVRDYVKGDPLKKIHWKLSARRGEYLTRLYEAYTNPGVAVVMDFSGPSGSAESKMGIFDCVVETGLSVISYAKECGIESEVCYVDKFGRRVRKSETRKSDMPALIADMPAYSDDPQRQVDALGLVHLLTSSQQGQSNLVVCTANVNPEMVSAILTAQARHRSPILFAIAPRGLEGRDRERWAAPLARLDAAGVGYVILSRSEELEGVRA